VGYFFRRIQNNSPYSDVTGSPFKLPTDSPRDLKWQIRMVTVRITDVITDGVSVGETVGKS
jgi:hypothetical protein